MGEGIQNVPKQRKKKKWRENDVYHPEFFGRKWNKDALNKIN